MKKTITLFLVFICATSLMFAFTPTAHSQSNNLQVKSYSWYTSPSAGYFVVVGEVQNIGADTVRSAVITGFAYDAAGEVQSQTENSIIYASQILPNDTAPFYMYFTENSSTNGTLSWVPTVDHIAFNFYVQTNSTQVNNDLYVAGHSGAVDSTGNYSVSGIVLNRGTGYPQNIWVVGTFYDSVGKVVAVGYSNYLTHYLPPNNYTQFSFTPTDPTPQMANTIQTYTLQVLSDGTTTEPTPAPSTTASTSASPIATPSQSASASTSPAGSDSSTSSTLLYVIVAAIAVALVILVLVLVLKRRK
jgi:hypothetical protein